MRDQYEWDGRFGFDCRYGNDSKWVDPNRCVTKAESPYAYSEFFLFGNRETIKEKGTHADYSDRLAQWDHDKFDKLWKKHVDCRFDQASIAQFSAFMSAFHGKKLRVVALAEGCNSSNGYPYWIVWYRED